MTRNNWHHRDHLEPCILYDYRVNTIGKMYCSSHVVSLSKLDSVGFSVCCTERLSKVKIRSYALCQGHGRLPPQVKLWHSLLLQEIAPDRASDDATYDSSQPACETSAYLTMILCSAVHPRTSCARLSWHTRMPQGQLNTSDYRKLKRVLFAICPTTLMMYQTSQSLLMCLTRLPDLVLKPTDRVAVTNFW